MRSNLCTIDFILGRGLHYNIRKDKTYFMTMTVVDWIDLFTRVNQKQLIVDSLKYCQENKGLNIFGWCPMPSHLHQIANTKIPFDPPLGVVLARVVRLIK